MSAQNSIYQLLANGEIDDFSISFHKSQQNESFYNVRIMRFETVAGQYVQGKTYGNGKSPEEACFNCLKQHTKRLKMMEIARASNQKLVADILFGKPRKTRLKRTS